MKQDDILEKISQSRDLGFVLEIDKKVFKLDEASLAKSKIPVRKPTTRGGVYFSDTTAYKLKAVTRDLSIIELLPKLMLGPNTEFKNVEIKTRIVLEGTERDVTLSSHIAHTMNTKDRVELDLIVDDVLVS